MKKARFLFFVGIVFLFTAAPLAQAAPVNPFYYTLDSTFTAVTWTIGGTGATTSAPYKLSWGSSGTSSMEVTSSPILGSVITDGVALANSVTITHYNQPIDSDSTRPDKITLSTAVQLYTDSSHATLAYNKIFDFFIDYTETDNGSSTPNDIFALLSGLPNLNFTYGGDAYYVNLFPLNTATGGNAFSTLPADYALAAGVPTGTVGFTTPENANTPVNFAFTISTRPLGVVPEPSTLILLGFGMVGLAGIARRKLSK